MSVHPSAWNETDGPVYHRGSELRRGENVNTGYEILPLQSMSHHRK